MAFDGRCGLPKQYTDANGLITSFTYDSYCRKTQQNLSTGAQVTWSYAYAQGQRANVTMADHSVYAVTEKATDLPATTTYYDSLGRQVRAKTTGFAGQTAYQDTVYDACGLKVKATLPYFDGQYPGANANWLTYEYDALLRPTAHSRPSKTGSEESRTAYTGLDQTQTDAQGIKRVTQHKVLGQVATITEGNGSSTISYTYDALGQLLASNANGTMISHTYDALGNKTQTADPSLGTLNFTYNGFGEVLQQTDAKGQHTQLSYDVLGRMTQSSDPSQTSQYQYDQGNKAKGKLSQVMTSGSGSAGAHTRALAYNTKGLTATQIETIDGANYTTATQYDNIGRVAQVTLPDGIKYLKDYVNGELHSIQVPKEQIWDHNYLLIEQSLAQSRANISVLVDRMQGSAVWHCC